MTSNVTLRLDSSILVKARHLAVNDGLSLSAWLTSLVRNITAQRDIADDARRRSLQRLKKGYSLGGETFSRNSLYE